MEQNRREFLATAAAVASAAAATGQEPKASTVDARGFALTQETPPKLAGNPMLMQFTVEKLPEGLVDLQIDAKQVYQLANLTNKEGKLRALVLPKNDGTVKVYELTPKTEVRLQIFMGKAEKPFLATGTKYVNFKYSEAPNWVKAIADEIESNAATKGAQNANASRFYKSDMVGNFEESTKTVLAGLKDYKLSWDAHAEDQIKAKLNPSLEK
jgi:hypothetical protein